MFPQPAGGRKYFPRVYWILKHRFLCYRNKQTFFDGKNVLTVMVPILIDKDVFEPSYNDLKFTIQNRSYFCTNLILNYRRRQWQPTPVLLPGRSHGWRSLVGCSPWGHYESDTTEWLHFHALEKEMATHSSVLAWRILGTGEPGGLLSLCLLWGRTELDMTEAT